MIQRQKLSRGIKSRLVSTDTSGISFLTPIDGGSVMRSNSGARHATGGMFRDLRNISNDPPDHPEKIKWPLGARSSDALEDTVMKSLREEVVSLKVIIQNLEIENVSYREQLLSCAPELIQHTVRCDFSTQTDVHETLHQTLAEKSIIIEILNSQIRNLQSELDESLKRNILLVEKNHILQSEHDENIRLWDLEKEINKKEISNIGDIIEEQRKLNYLALPIASQETSFLSQNAYLDRNECSIIFQKFRSDHKSDEKFITKTLALFHEDLQLMKSDLIGKIKSEFQNVIVKYENQMNEKDEELFKISSRLIKSDELLSTAVNFGDKKTKDFLSISLCLNAANEYLSEIILKHNSLIQSVLHDAHVKDLARISALRESALERDKVTNDLEFCRYLHLFIYIYNFKVHFYLDRILNNFTGCFLWSAFHYNLYFYLSSLFTFFTTKSS